MPAPPPAPNSFTGLRARAGAHRVDAAETTNGHASELTIWHHRRVRRLIAACLLVGLACGVDSEEPFPVPAAWFQRGMTFVGWGREVLQSEAASRSLSALISTGARWVAVIPTAYQSSLTAAELDVSDPRTPSASSVREVIRRARRLGLRVMLKPHVDVVDGSFRGRITPPDRDRWFQSYQAWVLAQARLASDEGVEQLSVGCELSSLAGETERWRALIAAVREVFRGRLTYAANWDEVEAVSFWDQVDLPGVDAYFPLSAEAHPSVLDLMLGWQRWLGGLEKVARAHGGRLLVTELGLASRAGSAAAPWEWQTQEALDLEVQAAYYEAALRVLPQASFVEGIFFWAWNADGSGGPDDLGFTPMGKPAEETLRRAWSPPPPP